jgi:hypothetical protein
MYHPQVGELVRGREDGRGREGLKLEVVSGAGHHLYLDNVAEFHAKIKNFVE